MNTYKLNINVKQNSVKDISLKQKEIDIDIDKSINVLPQYDHNKLNNLDYENSGHTGFASSKDLENYVPKQLSILPKVDDSHNRSSILIYANDNGKSCYISMKDMLSKQIRTSSTITSDMQLGKYLFLEKRRNKNG